MENFSVFANVKHKVKNLFRFKKRPIFCNILPFTWKESQLTQRKRKRKESLCFPYQPWVTTEPEALPVWNVLI